MSAGRAIAGGEILDRMERMYRPQRLIYDLTRKYYLIGRDRLVAGLDARPGQRLIDIGCGTGRNLEAVARRYPGVLLAGLDAAQVMIEATASRFARAGLPAPRLARTVAEALDPLPQFGIDAADHIVFSYSLSMMPDPVAAIERAALHLAPGGTLHIVDFGPMDGLPTIARRGLVTWLAGFGVHHRPEIAPALERMAARRKGHLTRHRHLGGYAESFRLVTRAA